MVKGEDMQPRGRGFESWHQARDGKNEIAKKIFK